MKTCCSKDCPKTDERIIRQLCGLWYPYGGKTRCGKTFENWMKTTEEVKKIHEEYLKQNNIKEKQY